MKVKRTQKNKTGRNSKANDVSDTEEYADAVDPNSTDFIYDNVDEYFENQEREGARKLAKLMRKPKILAQEEVLGVASSSDDEESMKRSKKKKKLKKAYDEAEPLPPLDSDLEEEKEDDDKEGDTQWGKKRSAYYNADYVDEDWDDANESDAEVAELEEQEALAIQQRMAQQLEDTDFGLDFINHLKEADKIKEPKTVEEEKIDVNLSQLSKREKLKLLNEESPELLELAEDFKVQMTELKENLQPLLQLVLNGVLPPSPGVDFIKAKYNLIMNYCTQIGYYFILKSRRTSVQNHPVIKRLVQFRSLLHQLEDVGSKLQPEIDDIISKMNEKVEIVQEDLVRTVAPPRKKLRILGQPLAKSEKTTVKNKEDKPITSKKKTITPNILTKDEEGAIEFYKAVRQKKDEDDDEASSAEEENTGDVLPKEQEEAGEMGKRGINYQIAKNKGLTPHRPKEQRNPRVKHRMKFRKANIRRKGAIREPRKELQRYGGENSGIKATVIRSVKLK